MALCSPAVRFFLALILLLAAPALGWAADADPPRYSGRLIIKLNTPAVTASAGRAQLAQARTSLASKARSVLASAGVSWSQIRALPFMGMVVATPSDGQAPVLASLSLADGVAWVEQARVRHLDAPQDEPLYRYQWGLKNTADPAVAEDLQNRSFALINMKAGADVDAETAWQTTTGSSGVVAAILDTGADYTHPDLAPVMWTNPGEIPDNGIDDDQNGYVDDVYGINAFANTGDPMDTYGHGTHVSGIVAAAANGLGTTGLAPGVRIMAVNVMDPATVWEDDAAIITGLEYIVQQVWAGTNVRVVNMSLSGPGKSLALETAMARLEQAGVIAVLSAGNDASDTDMFFSRYPTCEPQPHLIVVGASGPDDTTASFSTFGPYMVDIFAPGLAILSTIPPNWASDSTWEQDGAHWGLASGTSMSAPMVAGGVALAASAFPEAGWRQIKDLVLGGADTVAALNGLCRESSRLNAARTVAGPIPAGPRLYRVSSTAPTPGEEVTLFGNNLGGEAGSVTLDGTPLSALSWGPTQVIVRLPGQAGSALGVLTLTRADGASADMPLYLASTSGYTALRQGPTGPYASLSPGGGHAAVYGDYAYGLMNATASSGIVTAVWGRLSLASGALEYLAELPPSLEEPRYASVAGLGGSIYIAGGYTGDRLLVWDADAGAWAQGPLLPEPGYVRSPVLTSGQGLLYLTGGLVMADSGAWHLGTEVHVYNAEEGSWSVAGQWDDPRLAAGGAAAGGKLYLAGGQYFSLTGDSPSLACDTLDLATGQWQRSVMPFSGSGGALVVIGNRLAYFGPGEGEGFTTPWVGAAELSGGWPGGWALATKRFGFLDMDGFNAWAVAYGDRMFLIGEDYTGCPNVGCTPALRQHTCNLP